MKIHSLGAELLRGDRWTDGRTHRLEEANCRISRFCERAWPCKTKCDKNRIPSHMFCAWKQAAFKCNYTPTGTTSCHIPVFWRVREIKVCADRKTDTHPQSYAGRLEFWGSRTNNQNYSPWLKFKAINILNMPSRITQTIRFLNWYRTWLNAKFIISRVIQVTTSINWWARRCVQGRTLEVFSAKCKTRIIMYS
jgi:hypothetical protein